MILNIMGNIKKIFICILFTVTSLVIMTDVRAESLPLKKFSRGAINVVTSPMEIFKQTRAYWIKGARHTPHIIVWIISGAVKGSVETVRRLGSGIWDMASCPWALPHGYEPLVKPDFVFQDWPSRQIMNTLEKKR